MQEPSPKAIDNIEVHAHIKGHVQGVGFRATVRHYARQLGVRGTVRNLADGSVEICAQGSQNNILKLFQALHQEFGPSHISTIDQKQATPQTTYEDFNIV